MIDHQSLNNTFAVAYEFLEQAQPRMTLIAEGELAGLEYSNFFFEEMTGVLGSISQEASNVEAPGKLGALCEEIVALSRALYEWSEDASWNTSAEVLNDTDVAREFYTMMMELSEKLTEGMMLTSGDDLETALQQLLLLHDGLCKMAEDFESGILSADKIQDVSSEYRQELIQVKERFDEAEIDMQGCGELFEDADKLLVNVVEDQNPAYFREVSNKLEEILATFNSTS